MGYTNGTIQTEGIVWQTEGIVRSLARRGVSRRQKARDMIRCQTVCEPRLAGSIRKVPRFDP
jgi:hypothetical protein